MLESEFSAEDVGRIHEALAHPVRVTLLRILRGVRVRTRPELRQELEKRGHTVDTRTLQFHLYKMARALLVEIRPMEGTDEVRLLRDVIIRTRIVAQA